MPAGVAVGRVLLLREFKAFVCRVALVRKTPSSVSLKSPRGKSRRGCFGPRLLFEINLGYKRKKLLV